MLIKICFNFLTSFVLALFFAIFNASNALSQIDPRIIVDKKSCENNSGNWRLFANGCVDSCISKLDRSVICSQALKYSCECGFEKCLDDEERCVNIKEFEKEFLIRRQKNDEELKKVKKEREERAAKDAGYNQYLNNLYSNISTNNVTNNDLQGSDTKNINSSNPINNPNKITENTQTEIKKPPINQKAFLEKNKDLSSEEIKKKIPPQFLENENKINESLNKPITETIINSDGKPQELAFPSIPLPPKPQ